MSVRNEFRLLLASEDGKENGLYLRLNEAGADDDRSIYMTVCGAGETPHTDDPVLDLSLEEATELREILGQLIDA